MVYYKPVTVIINSPRLVKIILDIIFWHHSFFDLIVSNRGLLFTSKFLLLLYYFLGIKQKLLTAFNAQTNRQTECKNSIIKVYLWVFVNFKENNWARLLPIAKFAYNNAKMQALVISHLSWTMAIILEYYSKK